MTRKVRTSPSRFTFSLRNNLDVLKIKQDEELNRFNDKKFIEYNLEYDLRTNDYIAEKCKNNSYAQNLYAALCNNTFMRNDVVPILLDKTWNCSWRYAGGIIASIRQSGDYIDWYCSGIKQDEKSISEDDISKFSSDERQLYLDQKNYVLEGVITDEIKQDLLNLGWLVINNDQTE